MLVWPVFFIHFSESDTQSPGVWKLVSAMLTQGERALLELKSVLWCFGQQGGN